jgi:hypothetical protein
MNATEIVKNILENDEDFDPVDFVKSATNRESAVEVYNGPLVRVIQPLAAFTINNYLTIPQVGGEFEFTDDFFKSVSMDGPIYLAVDKADHDNIAIFQPSTSKAWNQSGKEVEWKEIPALISSDKSHSKWEDAKNPQEDKNWLDLQQGMATFFMTQIAKKKNVGQWVKYLTMIGRTDLATNYARYLGRAKLPFGKSIDAVLAMKKAGKRSRNRIARLMKSQENVKWGERGFWLLFDDWNDLAPFFGDGRDQDYKKNAEKIFSGETSDWFDGAETKPEEVWDNISDKSMALIRQLLVNRTVYNSDGEEHLVTRENVDELTDDEIKDIVCDRGNKGDSCEDIYDAIRFAAHDSYVSSQESAYYDGYQHALMSAFGVTEGKTMKWIPVGKKEPDKKLEGGMVQQGNQKTMLGFWFPYSTLEQWIAKWKEDEYEDDFYGDIHDLALAYIEKVMPNDEYSDYGGNDDYFNEQLDYHLSEIDLTAPDKNADPNQSELPLEGEPEQRGGELQKNYAVHVGTHPNEKVYKGVPKQDATKYREAMKSQRDDITFRAESFLAQPINRLDERQGDVKIEFEASDEAAESIVPLLKELKKMGSQGSSRDIKIEDWDGRDRFGFDGDGASKIGEIKVDGEVVEKLLENDDVDPKAFLAGRSYILRRTDDAGNTSYLQMTPGKMLWGCQAGEATVFSQTDAEALVNSDVGVVTDRDIGKVTVDLELAEGLLQEAVYKLSTTQIDLPKEIGGHIIQWGELNIADDDLYIDEKDGCGRETEQHVTVLYGLTDSTPPEELTKIVESTKPFLIEFAGVSIFENEKYDVIKIGVVSEGLHNLQSQIRKACPNENKFPDYQPHCTIAYVKKGKGKKYAGEDVFKAAKVPRDFWAYDLLFKGAGDSEDGNRVVQLINFDKSKPIEEPDEPEAGDQRYPQATEEEPEMAVAESDQVDPKQFTQKPNLGLDLRDWVFVDRDEQKKSATYRHKSGRVQFALSYLGRGKFRVHVTSVPDGQAMSDWEDFPAESHSEAEATAMNLAYGMVHSTDPSLFQPVQESDEVDPKRFSEKIKPFKTWAFKVLQVDGGRMFQVFHLDKLAGEMHMGRRGVPYIHRYRDFLVNQIAEKERISAFDPGRFATVWDWLDEVNESDEADPKALALRVPVNCPKCGSSNVEGPDSEGDMDCRDCGVWFNEDERGVMGQGQTMNAKEFLARTTQYRVRVGVGAQTRYLWKEDGQQMMWKDFEDATLFTSDEAGELIDAIGDRYGGQPVVAELVDDNPHEHMGESDAKSLSSRLPMFIIQVSVPTEHEHKNPPYYFNREGEGTGGYFTGNRDEAETYYSVDEANEAIENIGPFPPGHVPEVIPIVLGVQEGMSGPFEDDGLPGEVTTFLRLQRGRAKKARKQQTGRSVL